MFKAIKEIDEFNQEQIHYYLTQGDSCKITSTPYIDDMIVPSSKIKKCVFKIANLSKKLIKEIDFNLVEGSNVYALEITSAISKELPPTQYVYEVEYIMSNDDVYTPNSWKFDIIKQITSE